MGDRGRGRLAAFMEVLDTTIANVACPIFGGAMG